MSLQIVASGLLSHRSVILSQEGGNFYTLNELTQCMKASMLLPGITGNPIYLTGRAASGKHIYKPTVGVNKSEPMCDALLYEPVPYR
ncbi:hypothetical protein EON65_05075 [archaeon]|nr:MAG: hypothetical protein EON65_05075 [archaeon]